MNKSVWWLVSVFCFLGCGPRNGGDDLLRKSCTLVGSPFIIRAVVNSTSPLPANLSINLNNGDLTADECAPPPIDYGTSVNVSADRLSATVFFELLSGTEFQRYFPNYDSAPVSNSMDLKFRSRTTCSDTPSDFRQASAVTIVWTPVYANGASCGSTSYVGESSTQL